VSTEKRTVRQKRKKKIHAYWYAGRRERAFRTKRKRGEFFGTEKRKYTGTHFSGEEIRKLFMILQRREGPFRPILARKEEKNDLRHPC